MHADGVNGANPGHHAGDRENQGQSRLRALSSAALGTVPIFAQPHAAIWLPLLGVFLAFATAAMVEDPPARNPFFAFDNGVGRGEWTPTQQAEVLRELGYAGIGLTGVEDVLSKLQVFENHQLTVFSLYVACYVDRAEAFAPALADAIKELKGTDVIIWLTVQGTAEDDERAVEVVREIADLAAASDIRVALYPHYGFHVATLDDALRIVKKVDRDNLGATFNLCHELRAGNEAKFDALLEEALPHLFLVSINGADHAGDWDVLIQTLGRGAFDVCGLLKHLRSLGYNGPIGLQCYNIPGDVRENLRRSIGQWQAFNERLDTE